MNIAVGCDHGGFPLKQMAIDELAALGHTIVDCGAYTLDSGDDYPNFARAVGAAVQRGEADRGVIICGSGIGASVAANKMRGIRAAVCHDVYSAHQGVEHDNLNVLCMGGRVVGIEPAKEILRSFASAQFSGDERHVRRLNLVTQIEKENYKS